MESSNLDEKFIMYMLEIEKRYNIFSKQEKIRIEQWVLPSPSLGNYAKSPPTMSGRTTETYTPCSYLVHHSTDQILKEKLERPFTAIPPDSALPAISKADVVSP